MMKSNAPFRFLKVISAYFFTALLLLFFVASTSATRHSAKTKASDAAPTQNSAKKVAASLHTHLVQVTPTPPPPPPPDSEAASGFRKLIVKNLGPLLNSKEEDVAPTVTADGRTMFFVSKRPGSLKEDFWMSTSPENNDTTWSQPVIESPINSDANDGAASIAADGQTIYMASQRNTTERGDINIWVATLEGKNWKNVREVGPPINTTKWETQPSISPDGKKLFFVSNRPGKIGKDDEKNVDIFVSHQLADGRWTEPANLGSKINTPGYDGSPFIAADGTTLYFCTNGHHGTEDVDLYMSEFKGPSDTDWTEPVRLPEPINSAYNDLFLTVPASGNVMYFTSDRPGGSGDLDIWVAFNPPKPRPTLVLRGICYDVNTNAKLAGNVVIIDETTKDTLYHKLANSETGEYLCVIPPNAKGQCGGSYLVSATEPNHFPYGPQRVVIPIRDDTSRIVTQDIPMNNEEPPVVRWVTEQPKLMTELPGKFPNFKGVIVREQKTVELYALLPMVFFEEGKSDFPSRYVLFKSPAETQGFTEDTITSTFNGYWNYLNVLGERLRKNPDVKVGLTGCNSMDVASEKSVDLSRQRAESIKKYLVDIWGIEPGRLPVEARNLPENSTLATSPEGIEENRRVEMKTDDWEIVKPIRREYGNKYPDMSTAKFSMKNGLRIENIQSRELVISHNGKEWARIKDLGALTATMSGDWNWRSSANRLPDDMSDLSVQMFVTDKSGRVVPSNIDNTGVRQFSSQDVTKEHLADKTRETYNLILFRYNSFEMGKWNQKILEEFVFPRVEPKSDVTVNGYTDILGTDDYNQKLSQNRADATRKIIAGKVKKANSMTSKGYGKSQPLYPNDLPEGRYYNRTVQVLVETPINNP
jgi:outer membrane protein OmpA-like peptidoglycan-associated protein/Tol biopolymer transport system component